MRRAANTDHEPSDADLLRRVPADAAAVEAFYRRHVDRVRAFAARRCARPEDVADAVSGTFLAVLDAAPGYDPRRADAVPWLLGIATNVLAGQRRRAARDRRTQERVRGRRLLDDDDHARIEAEIDAARLAADLRVALLAAPAREREVFLLVAGDGLPVADAARVLGISAIAARARLARLRRRLRRAAHADDAPPAFDLDLEHIR